MKVFETAFKKQYSVLNNTLNYLQLEYGLKDCYVTISNCPTESNPANSCYTSAYSDCQAIKQGLINHLKLVPIKNDFKYPKSSDVLASGGIAVNKTVNYDGYKYFSAYLLPDGAVVMFVKNSTGFPAVAFVLDVNGEKGPNKWGYDVFYLTISSKEDKLRLADEYASLAQEGGRLPRTILLNRGTNESKSYTWN